jgi:uncharacterized protein YbjT (DUF2867 family)
MIAVVGATGNTGRAVVKELKALGHDPVCIVRNAQKAQEVLGPDAKTAVAELTDRPALEKALKGVTSVFVVTGHNPQMVEQQNNVLDAALQAGVEYVVRGHHAIEERLRASGIKWVILRPGLFMQNTFTQAALIKSDGKIAQPFAADLPLAFIDVRDTGAVGARILVDPAPHIGKIYEFTGVRSNYGEFAEVFSQVLGRKITYVPLTVEQNAQAMKARGMPDWLIAHLVTVGKLAANGVLSAEKTEPIREIAKRAPLTTRQFVEDFKAVFS